MMVDLSPEDLAHIIFALNVEARACDCSEPSSCVFVRLAERLERLEAQGDAAIST